MILAALALLSTTVPAPSPQALWEAWPRARFVDAPAACLRHSDLVARLQALAAKHPGRARLEEIGRSAEGRAIHLLTVGAGERRVLLWSQMHGDEPSATPALLDAADFLLSDEQGSAVLDALTLLIVPMLNPDGAERGERRNAQGIDVNRDALNLATPEGRILKAVRDRHQPILGFNLHDQDRRTMVGETGRLATIALLAVAGTDPRVAVREPGLHVAGDPAGTVTEGRLRAKRACASIVAALEPLIGPAIARYDEDWSPRAFGDNITAWGTSVVLVESGGLAAGRPLSDLTRLNFVAFVSVLSALAADDLAGHDPAVYERLTRNLTDAFADVVLRGGRILQGGVIEPYRADIAFDVDGEECPPHAQVVRIGRAAAGAAPGSYGGTRTRTPSGGPARRPVGGVGGSEAPQLIAAPGPAVAGQGPAQPWRDVPPHLDTTARSVNKASRIVEIGDARFLAAGRELDASGALIVPALTASVRGIAARGWLTPGALEDMARLGVGFLRWHVPVRHVGIAQAVAAERSGPGRPTITIVPSADPPSLLVLTRAPRRPVSRSLSDALDALGAWRTPKRPFSVALPHLTAASPRWGGTSAAVRLAADAPASFLVLRPGEPPVLEAESMIVQTVYIDGRPLEAPAVRGGPRR